MDQELVSYLDNGFGEIDQRFERVDRRFEDLRTEICQVGVTVEALRTQIQTVAEGVMTVDEKLERFRHEISAEHDKSSP